MLEQQLIALLRNQPGQTARQLASQLDADKSQVNSLLYGRLKGQFIQDKAYKWWPAAQAPAQAESAIEPGYADTALSRLARYYLACLGQDDVGEVSVWARSFHNDFDYVQLPELVDININSVLADPGPASLISRMQRDRSPKVLYLGFPVVLHRFTSKKGNDIYKLEPVFVLPIQFEHSNSRGTASIATDYPVMNTAVLKRYGNVDRDDLMSELIQLEEELGFGTEGEIPDLDEIAQRLQAIRADWPWQEYCDPANVHLAPAIDQLDKPGIYNRAVLVIAERKPYTQGLESELRELAKLKSEQYSGTALGYLVNNKLPSAGADIDSGLIEALPMNLEQRRAVEMGLHNPLTIITGPPGTGKSQVVTNLLVNAAWKGQKVLFASKNNKAVDVVEVRVNNLGPRPLLLRMGSNEYQVKLKDYLHALLAATASEDDQLDYDECVVINDKLTSKLVSIQKKIDEVVTARNTVDAKEQSVEEYRSTLGEDVFARLKDIDLNALESQRERFREALYRATRDKQAAVIRLAWRFNKTARFEAFSPIAGEFAKKLNIINVHLPDLPPSDASIPSYIEALDDLDKRWSEFQDVQEYFAALKALSEGETLEVLNKRYRECLDEIADNSQALWQGWLKVTPNRLRPEDRQLLSQYVSVLQMITEGANGNQNKSIWRQYYELTRKVSHLLPCWAVTSLSARGKLPFSPGYYDLVVFDEASQCDIASALPLLYRAKQAVVIGDPMQLSHISGIHKHQDQQLLERFSLTDGFLQWAYSWNSLFDMSNSYAKGENIVDLRDHHRSHADIINFSNEYFYEGKLRVATHYDKLKRPSKDAPGVRWLQVTGETQRPPNGGAYNPVEARAIVDQLRHLVIDQGYRGSIGVVSPFRAQANLVKDLVNEDQELEDRLIRLDFLSDTVHRFQGDERDLIVFSPVISTGATFQSTGFLKRNGNLFNVAITRARSMLLVVGDSIAAKTCEVEYLAAFANYIDEIDQSKSEEQDLIGGDCGPIYPTAVDRSKVSQWEVILYEALYNAGVRTIPQYPVEQYLLDFALVDGDRRLNIEVDGERYHRSWTGELSRRDQIRNQRMFELGWDVIRFWVYEIRDDLDGCIARVQQWVKHKDVG